MWSCFYLRVCSRECIPVHEPLCSIYEAFHIIWFTMISKIRPKSEFREKWVAMGNSNKWWTDRRIDESQARWGEQWKTWLPLHLINNWFVSPLHRWAGRRKGIPRFCGLWSNLEECDAFSNLYLYTNTCKKNSGGGNRKHCISHPPIWWNQPLSEVWE